MQRIQNEKHEYMNTKGRSFAFWSNMTYENKSASKYIVPIIEI